MPDNSNNSLQFWQELKRRKVFRVIIGYLASAYVLLELTSIVTEPLRLPEWTINLVLVLLCIGFVITVVISWIYDFTPEGIKKTESAKAVKLKAQPEPPKRKLRVSDGIIAILVVVVCVLLYPKVLKKDKFEEIGGGDGNSPNVIAVLPFSNTKPDPETDYLGFAIANQIIGNLVYLKNITVRPSSAIRKYEKQMPDPMIVGDDLKVDYVLIGNYLMEGNIIRLNAELVKAKTNEMIWRGDQMEVDFHNAFELQDIVAQEVVKGMQVQFSQKELNRIGKDVPGDPLAYEFYLRSISFPYTIEGDKLAIEMLNKSIELDSTYAPAYDHLGFRIKRLSLFGLLDPEETLKAETYFLKAVSLNGTLLSALGNLAMLYTETSRIEEALEITKQMLDINPNNADTHYSLGYIYRYAGMLNESILEMEKAVELEPKNSRFRALGITFMNIGEYEKAFKAFEVFQESPYTIAWQGIILFRQNKPKQALENFRHVIEMEPDKLWGLLSKAHKAYIEGNINEGLIAVRGLEQANITDAEGWYYWASFYALLGDRDGCIRCLNRAVDGGFFNYPFMLNDFYLDSVRDDPEFQEILEKAKRKHLAFKKRFF